MPSGWTRWILEQFEFPFEVVYPQALDAGNLAAKYDVIILPSGVGPQPAGGGRGGGGGGGGARRGQRRTSRPNIRMRLGAYTAAQTLPQPAQFLEAGGTILAVGRSAMNLAQLLELPHRQPSGGALAGRQRAAAAIGEVLRARLGAARGRRHHGAARARGRPTRSTCSSTTARCSSSGPTPRSRASGRSRGSTRATPLRSGWAYGQGYLKGGVAVARGSRRQGQALSVRPGDHLPRAAARHVQVPVQRDLSGGRGRPGGNAVVRRRQGEAAAWGGGRNAPPPPRFDSD